MELGTHGAAPPSAAKRAADDQLSDKRSCRSYFRGIDRSDGGHRGRLVGGHARAQQIRNCDRGNDENNSDYDQEFDQRKAFLPAHSIVLRLKIRVQHALRATAEKLPLHHMDLGTVLVELHLVHQLVDEKNSTPVIGIEMLAHCATGNRAGIESRPGISAR